MTKKRSTKRALALSLISLLLCFSMFVGTTFAWFTDSVSSLNNKIVAGNLDVELEFAKVVDGTITGWTTVQDNGEIFDPNALWEPGRVEVVYLKVSNLGTLALKYQLGVNVYGEIIGKTEDGKDIKLSEHLVFKAVEMPDALTTYTDREAVALAAGTEKGLKDYNGKTTALEVGGEDYVALIVYMPETVGNEANYRGDKVPTITLGINLYATQVEAESDSFGDDYDADAWHPDMTVYNEADLKAALATGGNIELGADVEVSSSVEVPAGVTVTLNLNGKTITGTKGRDADNNRIHVIVNNGTLTIKDGTVKSAGNDGGSAILNNAGATLTIEDVTLYGAPQSDPVYEAGVSKPFPSYAVNNYGNAVVNGATVKSYHGAIATGGDGVTVINDADIDVGLGQSTGITSYAIYSYENAQVTVNGGKFAFTKQEIYVNGGNTFCEYGTNPIIINGGNYINTSFSTGADREYVIKGGTFDKDPSAYVADGFKAVADQNGVYRVISENASLIYTADALKEALANGGEYVLSANIAAGDTTFTVTAGKEAVLDLNGFTISGTDNLTASYGLINVGAGADLTINDSIGTGKIVCSATNNRGWNAYSSVVSNQRGTLTVNGGIIEHLGGTDMAYAIDNLTNGKGTYAETVINGGTLKSTYIGIRQFCNGIEAQNIVKINGGVIEGGKRSVWMQDPNANANTGSLTINGGTLNGGLTIGDENFEVKVNGGNFTDLATAVAYATNGTTVGLAADYAGNVTVTQKPDVKITVDGNGNTFAGVITVDGKSATYTTAGLTLKNIVFKADSVSADACIQLGNGTNATRYTCNVTVDGCTFDVPGVVGVKSYTGGDKNVQIIGCTATANAHSLAQLKGVDGVLVKGCTVNSVRGVNFNNSDNVVVDNCTFDVEKYALRFGESSNTTVENYEVKNCTITSANVDGDAAIVLRAGATNANLTITNTSIAAGVQMSGHENASITIQ